MLTTTAIDRTAIVDYFRRNRQRSAALFDMVDPAAYYSRPISLRNPIVFYEGHLPAFSVLAFLRRGLGRGSVDARLEKLFERGIDPDSEAAAIPRSGASTIWPPRSEVLAFARACDDAVLEAIADFTPAPEAIEGLYTALEHEAMHQETLLYMWHQLPYEHKRDGRTVLSERSTIEPRGVGEGRRAAAEGQRAAGDGRRAAEGSRTVIVPAGTATLGARRDEVVFGWDNEFDAQDVFVPAFDVDVLPVTNAEYAEFVAAGNYGTRDLWTDEGWEWIQTHQVSCPAFWLSAPLSSPIAPGSSPIAPRSSPIAPRASRLAPRFLWRGMLEALPLPPDWPVYVSHAEASAYARWKRRRLMTEAQWHRAAQGAAAGHADFAGFDPIPAGSRPETASVHGVHDLIGNGWEWTSTVFGPLEGFTAMRSYPEYSTDFFDGRHFVMKGASPATARELVRPSFRNWFRGNYPYVYAKFRTVGA